MEQSLLIHTLEAGDEEETNFYSRLIDGKYIEIAKVAESLIKKEVPDRWKEILTTRVKVGKAIEKEPESGQESESSEKKFNYGAEVRLLPCFSALQNNQIQLIKDLILPLGADIWKNSLCSEHFTELELWILNQKVQTNWINPFSLKDTAVIEKLGALSEVIHSKDGLDLPVDAKSGTLKFLSIFQESNIGLGLILKATESQMKFGRKLRKTIVEEAF